MSARSRVAVTQEAGRLAVRIGVPRSGMMIVFLLFWLVGWAGGEAAVLRALTSGQIRPSAYGFLAAWLLLWTAGGAAGVLGLLWAFAGHELVAVEGPALTLRRAAGPIGRTQAFPLSDVRNLRYLAPTPRTAGGRPAPGGLAFDVGTRTVGFGTYLEPEDAQKVIGALSARLPAAPRTPHR